MAKTKTEALNALKAKQYTTNIAGEIERIEDSKIVIIDKLHEIKGLSTSSSIDAAAITMDGIVNKGTPTITLAKRQTAIPEGYYQGGNIVVPEEGISTLYDIKPNQEIVPTKAKQVIKPDGVNPDTGSNWDAFAQVTVAAIPDKYQDITGLTAQAPNVLVGKIYYGADGRKEGTMPDRGTLEKTLTTINPSQLIAEGHYDGGEVKIIPQDPVTVSFNYGQGLDSIITAEEGKVLNKVIVKKPSTTNMEVSGPTLVTNPETQDKTYKVEGKVGIGYVVAPEYSKIELGKHLDAKACSVKKNVVTIPHGYAPTEYDVSVKTASNAAPVLSKPTTAGVITVTRNQTEGYVDAENYSNSTYTLDAATISYIEGEDHVSVGKGWVGTPVTKTVTQGSIGALTLDSSKGTVSAAFSKGWIATGPSTLTLPAAAKAEGALKEVKNVYSVKIPSGWRSADEYFNISYIGKIEETVTGLEANASGYTIMTKNDGYAQGGTVKLDGTIFNRLAAI